MGFFATYLLYFKISGYMEERTEIMSERQSLETRLKSALAQIAALKALNKEDR